MKNKGNKQDAKTKFSIKIHMRLQQQIKEALVVLWAVTTCSSREPDSMGRSKARIWAVRAGPWPSEPLRPRAVMGPEGIVKFFIFPCIYSNVNQIQFGLNWFSSKFVQTECLNGCQLGQWIQI
jgi:hypothetical protein